MLWLVSDAFLCMLMHFKDGFLVAHIIGFQHKRSTISWIHSICGPWISNPQKMIEACKLLPNFHPWKKRRTPHLVFTHIFWSQKIAKQVVTGVFCSASICFSNVFFSFVGAKLMGFWVEFLDKTCKSDCQPKLPINNYSELLCALQTHPEKIFGLFCLFVRCVCFCCKIFPSSRSFIEQSRLAKSPASLWSLNGRGEMNRTLRLIAKIHGKNRHLMHGW